MTASLAAVKETSLDAAIAAGLSELGGISTLKEERGMLGSFADSYVKINPADSGNAPSDVPG